MSFEATVVALLPADFGFKLYKFFSTSFKDVRIGKTSGSYLEISFIIKELVPTSVFKTISTLVPDSLVYFACGCENEDYLGIFSYLSGNLVSSQTWNEWRVNGVLYQNQNAVQWNNLNENITNLKDSVNQLLQGDEDMSNIEKILDMPVGAPFISAHKEFINQVSPEAVQVIILHEEGHIALGHYVHYDGLGHHLQHELEADAYAAARVGKPAVAKALEESIRVLIPYMGVPESKREDCLKHVLSSENMLPRFEALK